MPAVHPTLASFFGATGPDAFLAALPGEVEDTLANGPNYIFIHPRTFTQADGPKSIRAKALAWASIEQSTEELTGVGSAEEWAEITKEQENMGVLLTFLWASKQGLLNSVTLSDVAESPRLNHQCELIAQKIRSPVAPTAGASVDTDSGLATATQSAMLSVQKTEETRKLERAEDKSGKSLIQNLPPPRQQVLLTKPRATHVHKAPVMPAFLTARA